VFKMGEVWVQCTGPGRMMTRVQKKTRVTIPTGHWTLDLIQTRLKLKELKTLLFN